MAKKTTKKQSDLSPETQLGVLVILALLLPLGFYFFFYSDKSEALERKELSVERLTSEIVELKQRESQLLAIREESRRMEARLSVLRAKIPASTDELNFFLESISQRARSSKISKWTLFKQENLIARDEVSAVPIRMEFISTYEAAVQFFWDLASMGDGFKTSNREQIINIKELQIERQSTSNKEESVSALLKIRCVAETYLYTGQKIPTTGGKP